MTVVSLGQQGGKVSLPSGTWDWRLRPVDNGGLVTFMHRNRPRDELRTWTPETQLSQERAEELAGDPVERMWEDADGLLWTISVSLPSDWGRDHIPESQRIVRLVFTCGGWKKVIPVPAHTRLGEISHFELSAMMRTDH